MTSHSNKFRTNHKHFTWVGDVNCKVMLILAVGWLVASTSFAAVAPGNFRAANLAAQQHIDEFVRLDDDPSAPALLEAQWEALRQAAGRWLDQHPKTGRSTFEAALKALKPKDLDATAVQLDDHSWLVSVDVGGFGSVFILADHGHGFSSAWAIDRPQTWASRAHGRLKAWSPDRARDSCRTRTPEDKWDECGPLSGRIGLIRGSGRFYIEGEYAQVAGVTIGAQLSLWSWNGVSARPIFSRYFNFMADQPWTVRVTANRLDVRSKDDFRRMSACGGCEGRQLVTSFRLTPAGVDKLNSRSLTPELDLVDAIYDRIARQRPTSDLASHQAAKVMAQQLKDDDNPVQPRNSAQRNVGMIQDWKILGSPGHKRLCLETDFGGAALFYIGQDPARVVAVRPAPSGTCGGSGAHD